MGNIIEDGLQRVAFVGNSIKEVDNYFKLNKKNPRACKDRLRGFFGEQHGDWNKANEQAETAVILLNAMGQEGIGFGEALKAEKKSKGRPAPEGLPA